MPAEAETSDAQDQRTAKRKTHRKSRNGCFQCKQRHTKCNEDHPRCANCVRLDIHCTWPSRERFSTYPTPPESGQASTLVERPVTSPDIPPDTFGSNMSMADLRLLHHWTSKTYRDMNPNLPAKHRMWQTDFMDIALDNPFVLRGFLALAAIHKVLTDPEADRRSLLSQADSHISKALATYRQNLEQPRDETAVPQFLLSSVLVTYNLASAQLETPDDPINAMHHCFRLVQGVRVVIAPHWEQVTSSKIFVDMVESSQVLEPLGDERVAEILRLKELAETKKASSGDSYAVAIDELHAFFIRVRRCTPEQDRLGLAFSWTASLPEDFSHLVSTHDPIAVLVLAHFAVLLAECPPTWWICEWPQRIIFAAQKLLMAKPELLSYLDWPLQVINAKT